MLSVAKILDVKVASSCMRNSTPGVCLQAQIDVMMLLVTAYLLFI